MNVQTQSHARPNSSLIAVTHAVYALHAVSLCIGAFSAASVVGSFLFGWPSLIAVVLNYAMRRDARGTWLDSHFSWQIRTFWYAVAISVPLALISIILAPILVGFATWIVGFFIVGIWASVRIARGWMRLSSARDI
jgi:uncharacterized membrane protein